jgi:hypothetical protein
MTSNIPSFIPASLGATAYARNNSQDPKATAKLPAATTTQTAQPIATTPSAATPKLDAKTTAQISALVPKGYTSEQLVKLATDVSNAKTDEERDKILSSYTSQGQKNKLETLLALIIPVLLNNGKVDANQVAWWKEALPAMTGMFK